MTAKRALVINTFVLFQQTLKLIHDELTMYSMLQSVTLLYCNGTVLTVVFEMYKV